MGENEIEVGGAMASDDQNVDIDVALSYIDDKIQDILGEYQKDFEGGVSAETLGARFGGYGSFLPTYRRSPPVCSNLLAQQKVQNQDTKAASRQDQLMEGAVQNSIVSHQTLASGPKAAARSSSPPPVARPSPEDHCVNLQSSREHVSNNKPSKVQANQSDQNTLKVRIKMGSDNSLLVQKNAAIYNNLGLEMSPFSSSEDTDSPSEREFPDSLEEHIDSPSCIVKIMTAFPIPGQAMLSPLPDVLANLLEQKDLLDKNRTVTAPVWEDEEVTGEQQKKLNDRSVGSMELNNENYNDPSHSFSVISKNETRMETSRGDHMLSDAGNHPPGSQKTTEVGKVDLKTGPIFGADVSGAKRELCSKKDCKIHEGSAKATLIGKVKKHKKLSCSSRDDGSKGDKSPNLLKGNHEMSEGLRECRDGKLDLTKQKVEEKKAPHLQDEMKVAHGEEQISAGKRKLKGSKYDCSSAAGLLSKSMRIHLCAESKGKIFQKSCFPSKSKGDSALLKDSRKVKVKHNVSAGERKAEMNKSRCPLLGNPVEDKARDRNLEVPEEEPHVFRKKSKVSSDSISKAKLRGDTNGAKPLAAPLPTRAAPLLINEFWVSCDKCHKWRLLPYSTNPDQLPKKWLCGMLDWLPGMNQCTVTEDETTNALRALYQLPVAGNHDDKLSHSVTAESSFTLSNAWHEHDQNPLHISFSGGKKKPERKEVSNQAQYGASRKQLNSVMRNEQVSVKRNSHNESSSLETKLEKRSGDLQPLKIKTKREADQEGFKLSKKARTEGMHYAGVAHNTGGFSKEEMENSDKKCSEYSSSRDERYVTKDSTNHYVEKHKKQFQKAMITEDRDTEGIKGKKKKSKDCAEGHRYQGNHSGDRLDNFIVMKESSWSKCRKGKKARKSNFEGKESSANKGGFQVVGQDEMKDDKNSERRDLRDGVLSVRATSCSSMISNTCKVKINIKDVKVSPVESVCSSPSRISNRGSPTRSFSGNHGCMDVGFSHYSGQTECLEGEYVGASNWSENSRKENGCVFALTKEKSREMHRHDDNRAEKNFSVQNVSSIRSLNNGNGGDERFGCEGHGASHWKIKAVFQKDCKLAPQHNVLLKRNSSGPLNLLPLDRSGQVKEAAATRKSLDSLFLGNKKENRSWKGSEYDGLGVEGSSCDDLSRAPRRVGKNDGQIGIRDVMLRHSLLDVQEASNMVASDHVRNDFFSQLANGALNGAKNLKHSADHLKTLKISASGLQSTELFFQAALKFLHGTSLSNPLSNKNTNNEGMTSAEMYGHAAKQCEYCASEFERCNDMASAFLAYKCTEVAYMLVVYHNDLTASRDRNELQTALQRVSPVESPSSSASVVENLNNEVKVGKLHTADHGSCSQAARDHIIAARNHPNFVRLLDFAENVNLAMEASRRSQVAFAATEIILAETGNTEGISSIRNVLHIGFHDVERLLDLIDRAIKSLHKNSLIPWGES